MIVPMKHITLLAREEDTEKAIRGLARLGVLHLDMAHPEGDPSELRQRVNLYSSAVRQLDKWPQQPQRRFEGDLEALARQVAQLRDEISESQKAIYGLRSRINELKPLESFDPAAVHALADKANVHIRLYAAEEKQLLHLPEDVLVIRIGHCKRQIYVATLQHGSPAELPLTPFPLPDRSLDALKCELQKASARIKQDRDQLTELTAYRDHLEEGWFQAEDALKMAMVGLAMPKESVVRYLYGFVPHDGVGALQTWAAEHGYGLLVDDPDENHEPPTLIRNPKWLDGIGAVFKMINVFPGYKEVDISHSFMLFLTLFFAILIGDAGYGVIILLLCVGLMIKLKNPPKELLNLGFIFGAVTVIWGAITGNWFASRELHDLPLLSMLTIPRLDAHGDSTEMMMEICFIIGATHLSLAHALSAIRISNSLRGLGEIGWVLFVWGMYCVVRLMVMDEPMPMLGNWLLGLGAALILCFTSPSKNIIKTLGMGFIDLLGKVVSCFADIVSYIRLFAAGMATFAVAASFNEIAAGLGKGAVAASAAVLILIVGHTINMVLAALAVVVHGIRLNLLEYSGHVGIQWSGSEYTPFTITEEQGESS